MSKGMMLGALLLAATGMQAETVILKQAVPQKNVLGGWSVKEIQKSETVTKDKAVCKVIKVAPDAKLNFNSYQAWCGVKVSFKKGEKYRVCYTLVASDNCTVGTGVCMMSNPWTGFAPVQFFKLKKDKPQKVVVNFTAGKDFNGMLRAPYVGLGNLKAGQSVGISDFSFVKLD